ncbi:ABC transporter substrate-binding protein [Albidovulum sp.]|uniref:ABC transporter substrate-binding protein n=1 Tax=Albidovulum sp. TaxID=1872424 RepID=UPI001E0BCB2E|nr:ABC transporter substrate-binding protein [Paracoccaceae bacterium]MCC0046435.1 ABC transporter substrate-binding protein [Defluviimonas sp.]HPE24512.1 ABC transporter substrate-binding protein [Albidovulum sp.]MCB2122519.1 ABC transporter substrate-binding protein [Paracoccaceae bacterium]MCB2144277.1 ABC transporter substrate-binding protein [Paracoccaceae bacterium]
MKKLLAATASVALFAGAASAEDIKIGVVLGFTGPLESITPAMGASAELAMKEVSDSGKLLGGSTVTSVRGDSTCVDAAAATAAAERVVTTDKVAAIMGADCSGVTGAILSNVAVPNGIVMISPSATSPALSTAEDNGLFFRTAPSDARQGEVVTDILKEKGVNSIALSYTNNDYGKGLAESIQRNFEAAGGTVTISAAHEDGKADYSAEVGALASAGGDVLVVAGYVDQGGSGVVRAALDTGAFSTFYFPDGMVGQKLNENFGAELNGSYGAYPGTDSQGAAMFKDLAGAAGIDGTSAFAPESYDAAALIMLSMAAAGSSNSADFAGKVMDIANAPGEKIYPGELAKALDLIAAGTEIDYEGASAVELVGPGESKGNYQEILFADGVYSTVNYR